MTRRAALVGLNLGRSSAKFEKSMNEMAALAEAAGLEIAAVFTQSLPHANTGYYIGSGKIAEIRAYLDMTGTDLVLFDNQLTPMQLRNLSNSFHCEVLDRTALILKIFAERARTREAALQVDYARLQYLLPRLAGMHDDLGRQAGASGAMSNKGAGEKKIELDRRHIEQQMAALRRDLEEVDRERATQRKARMRSGLPRVSLVGYTNAGKSTILNGFLLSDTVGFIDNLPTTLVKAFRSTLEETKYADLLLIVSDLSDPDYRDNLAVTIRTLEDIGAGGIPRIFIFNKADRLEEEKSSRVSIPILTEEDGRITMSAKSEADLALLVKTIEEKINENRRECTLLIPYAEGALLSRLKKDADMQVLNYLEDGTLVKAVLKEEDYGKLRGYFHSES